MTKEEFLAKVHEAQDLYDKFEQLKPTDSRVHSEAKSWLGVLENDIDEIPEKIREICAHNIDSLNLNELSSRLYNLSLDTEKDRYLGDKVNVIMQCKNFLQVYNLYKSVGYIEQNTVIVGANGCGKTTLANKMKKTLNIEDGIVIPAQKLLLVPTFENIPTLKAEKEPFSQYQKKIYDDKRTYSAKGQDDFPYDMAREYGSEYRKVLALLIAERNAKRNQVIDDKADGTIFTKKEFKTTIDTVIEIWNDLIPHRTMAIDPDCNLIIKCKDEPEGKPYEAYRMSDGERVILYLVGRIMQAPENGIIIVDEPEIYLHRTVVNKLWDRLELERKDCVFVYMTHDLHFATSRVGVKSWIKSYKYPSSWDIQVIDEKDIPEQLLLELLGSCKKILFCEGNSTTSLDKKIFDVLFPDFIIYPLESCKEVISYTKAYNAIQNANTKAYGLVDNDFRTKEEISSLKSQQIYTYHVAEIENLFLVAEFLEGIKAHHCLMGDVNNIKQNIIAEFEKAKEVQASLYVSSKIDYYYKIKHVDRGNTKSEVAKRLKEFNDDIDIEKWYSDRMREIELYIRKKSYEKIIAIYNNKGLHAVVEREFGIKDYHRWALEYLKMASESVIQALRKLFPNELLS